MPLMNRQWMRILATLCAMMISCPSNAQRVAAEDQVKAAFILNFARYVEWPAESFPFSDAPLVICSSSYGNIGTELQILEINRKRVQGRSVKVKLGIAADRARGCHVLFIPESDEARVAHYLDSISGRAILSVSDSEAFIKSGGAIGLVRVGGKLQFEISREALARARLKASSNLLRLARNLSHSPVRE